MFEIRYQLSGKVEPCDDEQLKIDIGAEIFDEIYPLKSFMKLNLDILHFENQCLKINQILNKNNLFLCIFELKEKFGCLIKQDSEKKKTLSEIFHRVFLKNLTVLTSLELNLKGNGDKKCLRLILFINL